MTIKREILKSTVYVTTSLELDIEQYDKYTDFLAWLKKDRKKKYNE